MSAQEKRKVLLLTDYELLKQNLNGLEVIKKSEVHRSILVTSHYANTMVRDWAEKLGAKVLPKQLASETPIVLAIEYRDDEQESQLMDSVSKVEVILVDDDKTFADSLIRYIFNENNVDYFNNPLKLKKAILNYSKET